MNRVFFRTLADILDAGGSADLLTILAGEREGRALTAQKALVTADGLVPYDEGLRGLWEEFEAQDTPEAKFAHTMDNLQPMMLNAATDGKAWVERGVRIGQILARNARTAEGSQQLWEYAKEQFLRPNLEQGRIQKDD